MYLVGGFALIGLSIALMSFAMAKDDDRSDTPTEDASADEPGTGTDDVPEATTTTAGPTPTAPLPPYDGWVNPASVGRPYGDTVEGLITFRGNPTRAGIVG